MAEVQIENEQLSHEELEKKDRTFVRAIVGKYSEIFKGLYDQPRVYKSKDVPWRGGPAHFSKGVFTPRRPFPYMTQALDIAIEVNAPGANSPKHGHMNGAVMYVLEGKGYEIHDNERADWEAGDAFVVQTACVHQHFNPSNDKPAKLLVLKSKALYFLLNLMFQKTVSEDAKLDPKWQHWKPE